jgi:hypothetical protein
MMTATEHDGGSGLAPVVDPPSSSYRRAPKSSRDNAVAAWHWLISPPFKNSGRSRTVFFGGGIFIFFFVFYLFVVYCALMMIYTFRFVVLAGALLIWGVDSLLGVFHRRAETKPARETIKMARKQTPLCG